MIKNNYLDNYKNIKVLVTGSTGFKGSWLCYWLNSIGAKVYGIGLKPERGFILYDKLRMKEKIKQYYCDIANFNKLDSLVKKIKPDIVFHLAAQSIVSNSYIFPKETIQTNVMGSANILQSVKKNNINSLVFITSDKCYLNESIKKNYKESDKLGGYDIYSASKASAEILFFSYYNSFYKKNSKLSVASARAGNVIGGGDFKENRIVPDFFKSLKKKNILTIRNPNATRPWQHVLEPLSGYLKLGSMLLNRKLSSNLYPSWNFGPNPVNCKKVIEILNILFQLSNKEKKIRIIKNPEIYESSLLSLSIKKANKELNWKPRLTLKSSLKLTAEWYLKYFNNENVEDLTFKQISYFSNL